MAVIEKHKPMRNRKLLDLAHRVNVCQIRIPGVCADYSAEGCEPAHGPKSWLDGGAGMKSSDVHAASCHACHVELDQGLELTRQDRQLFWSRGMARTFALYIERGWLVLP